MMTNQDFYGNRIWKETDSTAKQLIDLTAYLNKTMAPPWMGDQFPGGYKDDGEQVKTGFRKALEENSNPNQSRTFLEELGKNMGIKITPFDATIQESINEFNKRKGLQRLLEDRGIVKDFSIFYQPK